MAADTKPAGQSTRAKLLARKGELWSERASWISHWREISEYQQPRLGRFLVTDVNKGWKRHNSIYDNTPIYAARTLAAGMMSGMTSPARPWFRLGLADKDLMEYGPVKGWLHRTGQLMRDIFAKSNTYRALHQGYYELGLFGTWADAVVADFDSVIHHYPMTIGEYAIACDAKGRANTVVREFRMTVGQVVEQFGLDNVSMTVRSMYDNNQLSQWVPVIHIIQPRKDRDLTKLDNSNMPWECIYFEAGGNEDKMLSVSGFKRFPALCPRWDVTGNDIYGNSPGMEVLGDVKQLQHEQLRKSQGIDYQTNPPIQVPTSYKDAAKNRLPGGVMYVDSPGAANAVKTAFDVNLDLGALREDIVDVRERIKQGYYADLFLMLANDTKGQMTATEVAERHEEKMLMLGPVLERLHDELHSPLIEQTFARAADAGILPQAPEELQGVDLNVEFISVLAQAQRIVSAGGVDRLLGTVGSLVGIKPDIADKIDFDQVIDDYGDMYGVNPEIIVPDDVVAKVRAQRAQQQAAMQAAAAAPAMADTAKTASEIDPANLRNVMSGLTGYNTPGAPV